MRKLSQKNGVPSETMLELSVQQMSVSCTPECYRFVDLFASAIIFLTVSILVLSPRAYSNKVVISQYPLIIHH